MITLAKILLVIFILVHLAEAEQPKSLSRDFRNHNFKLSVSGENNHLLETANTTGKQIDYYLLSLNHPTKLSFRQSITPKYYVDAIIERLTSNTTNKDTCIFPVFTDDVSYNHMKLWSLKNNLEIFIHVKIYNDTKSNTLNIFTVNMTDCQYTKTEALQGYDYLKRGKIYFVFRPWDIDAFDIFTSDEKNECGTTICKRVYNIKSRSISGPMKFQLNQDWELSSILPSEKEAGYYAAAIKTGKAHLISLNTNGTLIHYLENKLQSRITLSTSSIYHDSFAICWVEERRKRKVSCTHFDPELNINANVTFDVGYEPKYLEMHNLPQGGFLVLTVSCSSDDCLDHEVKVTRFDAYGFHGEFIRFKDEGCAPVREQRFTFYEEKGRFCLFYACDWKGKMAQSADSGLRIRCLR